MKKVTITNVIVLLLSLTAVAQGEKLRVAVFDPTSSSVAIDGGTKEAVRELISSVFVNTGKYTMVERSMLQQIMKEQKMSNTDEFDDSQATALGKLAGANKVVLSVISMVGGRNMLSVKVIDVQTATVELQKTQIVNSSDLLDVVAPLTLELLGEVSTGGVIISTNQPNKTNNTETNKPNNTETNKTNSSETHKTIFTCGCEIQVNDLYAQKTTWKSNICPDGWRLPTRDELKCMCTEQKIIGNFKNNAFSNYFTSEFDKKGKIYVWSFDDCQESTENVDGGQAWVRCVRNKTNIGNVTTASNNPPAQNNNVENIESISVCGMEVMTSDLLGTYKWAVAMRSCPKGWRLPTSEELECLYLQRKRSGLDFKANKYWTSTEAVKKKDKALTRTIDDGKIETEDMDDSFSCRCVKNQ